MIFTRRKISSVEQNIVTFVFATLKSAEECQKSAPFSVFFSGQTIFLTAADDNSVCKRAEAAEAMLLFLLLVRSLLPLSELTSSDLLLQCKGERDQMSSQ